MTNEEMLALKVELQDRLKTVFDQFLGTMLTPAMMDQIRGRVAAVLAGWSAHHSLSPDSLGLDFEVDIADHDPSLITFSLQPSGFLAQLFTDAEPPPPVAKPKMRGFDPLWGETQPEPIDEGVPPVAKPHPRWFNGSDPFLRGEE